MNDINIEKLKKQLILTPNPHEKRLLTLFLTFSFSAISLFAQKDTFFVYPDGSPFNGGLSQVRIVDTVDVKLNVTTFNQMLLGGSTPDIFADTLPTQFALYTLEYKTFLQNYC